MWVGLHSPQFPTFGSNPGRTPAGGQIGRYAVVTSLRRQVRKLAADLASGEADLDQAVAQLRALHGPLAVTALARHLRNSGSPDTAEKVEAAGLLPDRGSAGLTTPSSILRHPSQWGKPSAGPG